MNFGSLFSGIGGIDLGLEWAGMTCKWQVEINDYCREILTRHWPNIPKHKNIREVGEHNLEKVDLITGGFPCQPFSVAGKRRGTEDNRFLWPEMLRVISEIRPRWVLAENVPGILSINNGMVIKQALSDLENEGYETMPPFIIPACAVDAPHRRDRVWIMAYSEHCTNRSYRREERKKNQIQGVNRQEVGCRMFGGTGETRSKNVPDTDKQHGNGGGFYSGEVSQLQKAKLSGCKDVPDNDFMRVEGQGAEQQTAGLDEQNRVHWWSTEPPVGRVAHGIPSRVAKLKALGNAVVPQCAKVMGEIILLHNDILDILQV